MRIVVWLFRGLVFFALFAFALNNQQPATVHWFFGVRWNAPLVIVVLAAFALGCGVGVLAMVPAWWRQRRQRQQAAAPAADTSGAPASMPAVEPPPRDAL
ncbi:MAG: LapA family protein [Rubrivivax sp.]|nr:LapA family protein [Rubrivivax sp.]